MGDIALLEKKIRKKELSEEELIDLVADFKGDKVGFLTGGGDAPGTNAVIEGILQRSSLDDILVVQINDGYAGLVEDKPRIDILFYHPRNNYIISGGSRAGSSRTNPEKVPIRGGDGKILVDREGGKRTEDKTEQVFKNVQLLGLNKGLITIGGNDTLSAANKLNRKGMKIVGIPKSIDFDYGVGYYCFGFQTAVENGVRYIDQLRTTAESHARDFVFEIMGRHAGHITLYVGIAAGADVILIPEVQYDTKRVFGILKRNRGNGARYNIIALSEGAFPEGGDIKTLGGKVDSYGNPYLKGIGAKFEKELAEMYGDDQMVRSMVIGHFHRSGPPSAFDRKVCYGYGVGAMELVVANGFGNLIGFKDGKYSAFNLATAARDRRVDAKKEYDTQRYNTKVQILK